jgi:hypothetical protein
VISSIDPAIWRQDGCGAWVCWTKYGDRKSEYGWEVDISDHCRKAARMTSRTSDLCSTRTTQAGELALLFVR